MGRHKRSSACGIPQPQFGNTFVHQLFQGSQLSTETTSSGDTYKEMADQLPNGVWVYTLRLCQRNPLSRVVNAGHASRLELPHRSSRERSQIGVQGSK
jgi:hypothetical protein